MRFSWGGIGGGRRFLVFASDTAEADVRAYQAILPEEWTVDNFDTGFDAWRQSVEKSNMYLTLHVTWEAHSITVYVERVSSEYVWIE